MAELPMETPAETPKTAYRREFFTGSLVLGLVLTAVMFLAYALRKADYAMLSGLLSIVDVAAVVAVFLIYGRRAGNHYLKEHERFTYGRAFGFLLMLSMLAGVVYGAGYYLLTEVIDPAWFTPLKDKAIAAAQQIYMNMGVFTPQQLEMSRQALHFFLHELPGSILSYVVSLLFQGGFLALFVASVIRRPYLRPFQPKQ